MNTPNEMRKFLGMMRNPNSNKKVTNESSPKKEMSMRDMLGKMRNAKKLNEATETTSIDQKSEEEKMFGYFDDDGLVIDFEPLKVYNNGVWWGGTINNAINWVYRVSDNQELNGVDINNITIDRFDKFSLDDEKIRQITDRLEDNIPLDVANNLVKKLLVYYNDFSDYWIENHLQK